MSLEVQLKAECLPVFGLVVFRLPLPLLHTMEKHGLYNDLEVLEEIRKLDEELRKPPFEDLFRSMVESIPKRYLRALFESSKRKRGDISHA